jgi:hypothetical protein
MRRTLWRFRLLSTALGGVLLQASCTPQQALEVFVQAASTVLTDAVFFALDSYLVSVS